MDGVKDSVQTVDFGISLKGVTMNNPSFSLAAMLAADSDPTGKLKNISGLMAWTGERRQHRRSRHLFPTLAAVLKYEHGRAAAAVVYAPGRKTACDARDQNPKADGGRQVSGWWIDRNCSRGLLKSCQRRLLNALCICMLCHLGIMQGRT